MERTLVLLKPDAVQRGLLGEIVSRFERKGLKIVGMKMMRLTDTLLDDPTRTVSGWRASIAADVELDRLYRATEQRVETLLDACPERRELVHGDLLNRNVLVSEDAARVTAVFSWKCSVRGDSLYDVAWCSFWSPWHPGVAALELWDGTKGLPSIGDEAEARHQCYLLHIGLRHHARSPPGRPNAQTRL